MTVRITGKYSKLRRKRRTVSIGDRDTRLVYQDRNLTPPIFSSSAFTEVFSGDTAVWAAVNTLSGVTFFDAVNGDREVSHEVLIEHDAAVTAEKWLLLEDGRRFDILGVEPLDERGEFMRLLCVVTGPTSKKAAEA